MPDDRLPSQPLEDDSWKRKFAARFRARAETLLSDARRLLDRIKLAASKAAKHRNRFGPLYDQLLAVFRMLKAFATKRYKPSWQTVVMAAVVVLYIASPIDFIPDFILGIGMMDDAAFFAWALKPFKGELDDFVDWERKNAQHTGLAPPDAPPAAAP
jgi:uncharacterized membrane protein YkvA (DUF1232 family)